MKEKISFVIPIFNEEENIPELYTRLVNSIKKDFSDFDYEIILVNDGSTDSSQKQLEALHQKDNKVKVIEFSRNFGHHIAITAGLDYAEGDYVVMMDGDLQDQPEEVIKLYDLLKSGKFDIVYGHRAHNKFGFFKRFFSKMFNVIFKFLLNESFVISNTIFQIMTKQVVENIRDLREQNRFIVGIIGWLGFSQGVQAVEHAKRYKGKTKYSFSKQVGLALNAIFSFSDYLLKLINKIGFSFILFSVGLITYALYKKIVFDSPVSGWTSLIISIFLIGGIQLIVLGIMGEYIGRTYMEIKKRPLYIVRKKIGKL